MTTRAPERGSWIAAAVAIVGLLAIWTGLSKSVHAFSRTVPTPLEVLQQLADDGPAFYLELTKSTLLSAIEGWVGGTVIALVGGAVAFHIGLLERFVVRLALVAYALPIIAIGPVLILLFQGNAAVILMAGLPVLLVVLIGVLSGLSGAPHDALNVVTAAGGGKRDILLKVRLWYAVPSIAAAVKIAAPTAFVSAIVGEFLAGSGGLGVALINSQQQFSVPRVWSLSIVGAVVSAGFYAAIAVTQRLLVPWSGEIGVGSLWEAAERVRRRGRWLEPLKRIGSATLVAAALLALWEVAIRLTGSASVVARGPVDIARYLTVEADAGAHRQEIVEPLLITARDAAIGYASGAVLAAALAIVVSLVPSVAKSVLSSAITLRTIPLVALTPLLITFAGDGLALVMLVGAVATFFPTFVNMVTGLGAAPLELVDVLTACGAKRSTVLRKVRLQTSVPLLFASAKLAVPTAVTGALLAEWFGTGRGLGYLFATEISQLHFTLVWTAVASITIAAMLVYSLLEMCERSAYQRFTV